MKKHTLLHEIELVRNDAELKEIEQGTILKLLILLLEYINDSDIEKAVNEVTM